MSETKKKKRSTLSRVAEFAGQKKPNYILGAGEHKAAADRQAVEDTARVGAFAVERHVQEHHLRACGFH